jgi:hypothetical protein
MSGAAGITSLAKNVEVARYHEEPTNKDNSPPVLIS